MKRTAAILTGLLTACLIAATAGAQDIAANDPRIPEPETRDPQAWQHLETLVATIESTRQQLAVLRAERRRAEDEREQVRLSEEIDRLSADLESLQTAWEMLATDGADLSLFGVRTEKAFDWREELESVFEPILRELRRATERPRKIERLRSDRAYFERRLAVAGQALQSIVENRKAAPTPDLKQAFAALEENWRWRRDNLASRMELIDFELRQVMAPPAGAGTEPMESLRELLSGRVLNLALAIGTMLLVYLLLRGLGWSYNHFMMRRATVRRALASRVGYLLFYLLTALVVLGAGMTVLYLRGDWVLLGLFILLLIGIALAAQKSLPRYLTEARLILNLGAVREGERIMYEGLPWRVTALTYHAVLTNPLLQGGVLRLPIRELVGAHSRVCDDAEPWFPARLGDIVFLDDGTYGKVITQTPELVQLQALGSVKSYPATAFLDQNPRNLSEQGFLIVMTFGLDYRHQTEVTTDIPQTMETLLAAGLQRDEAGRHLRQVAVEFAEAGASSLNLKVLASFGGEAAESYYSLQRLLQRLAVEGCNRHGWVIPFTQITVHSE